MGQPLKFSIFHGYPAELIADWCGVALRTAKRYKTGELQPSPAIRKLFLLHRDRRVLTSDWAGWVMKPGAIVDPDGNETTRAQLHGYWLIMQFARQVARDAGPEAYAEFQRLLA